MATWLVHLRICEKLIDKIDNLSVREFVIGNVAPDCGYGAKDSRGCEFTPPSTVTHWSPTGEKADIDADAFYSKYVNGAPLNRDISFYLGYYVHLITDIVWSKRMYIPTKVKYASQYAKNPDFLKIIKKDWYDLDHRFLRDHPNFRSFQILNGVSSVKDYLPYYEPGQLTAQVGFIKDYYLNYKDSGRLDRRYKYLTPREMDAFINDMAKLAYRDLKRHGYIKNREANNVQSSQAHRGFRRAQIGA